jgi:transmembrane sensor
MLSRIRNGILGDGPMTRKVSSRDELAEQAAECFLCLRDPEADPGRKRRWLAWLDESPAHREAFDRCRAIWSAPLPADLPWPSETEMAKDSYQGEKPIPLPITRRWKIVTKPDGRRAGGLPRWPGTPLILAAAALGVAIVLTLITLPGLKERTQPFRLYATSRGEQRRVTLPDGSDVLLGPDTRLEERFQPGERDVVLQDGEALFTVIHDESRPFRVYAGVGIIQDLGTVFDIRNAPAGVTVTVLDGAVQVTPESSAGQGTSPPTVTLTKGRQVTYRETLEPVRTVDPELATAWRDGRLVYVDQTLRDVVADLRRYSTKDIQLSGKVVEDLRFTGTIAADKIDQWAAGLAQIYPVHVSTGDRTLVIAASPGHP